MTSMGEIYFLNVVKEFPRYGFVVLIFFFSGYQFVIAQEFTASVSAGCAPLQVKFSTSVTGTYAWTFGKTNNNTSNVMEPEVTYDVPGVYTVSLSVNGVQPNTKVGFIKVYAIPSPDFDFQYSPGCAPLQVQFANASTSVPEVPITNYQWVFGDGSSTSVTSATGVGHTYNLPGDQTVTLIAKNDNLTGCSNSKVQQGVTVHDIQSKFSTPTFFCSAPATAQFTNNSIGPGQLSYEWTIDGATVSTQTSPSYTFSSLGTYDVALTVHGDFNCTATSSQTINVGKSSFAILADKDEICAGDEINFSVDQGSYLNSWTWDFGNGTVPGQTLDQKVKYTEPGSYAVTLKASSGACEMTLTKNITVVAQPIPDFTEIPQCNNVIAFTNTSQNSTGWLWDFGDGTTSESKNPQHTYASVGNYAVKLKALAVACAVDLNPKDITVYSNPVATIKPTEDILCDPRLSHQSLSGCAPLEVDFSNDTNTGIPLSSVAWSFGDGRKSTSSFPKIIYSTPGTYTVQLTVNGIGGCSNTAQATVHVFNSNQVTLPDLVVDNKDVCVGQEVNISAKAASPYPLCWELQPGVFMTGNNFTYKYTVPGSQTIKVKTPGCPNEKTFTDAITVRDPMVNFLFQKYCRDVNDPNAPNPYQVDFLNNSTVKDGLIYAWDFGDGTTSSDRDPPRHTFPIKPAESITYSVILNVQDPSTQCNVFLQQQINIQEVVADFLVRGVPADNTDPAKSIKACKNDEISFTDNSLFAATWSWYFDDPTVSKFDNYSSEQNPDRAYQAPGSYTVNLTVSDGTCSSAKAMAIPITVSDIAGDFDITATSDCSELKVQFTDKSVAVPPVSTWRWNFGNGDISNDPNPEYTYNVKGKYSISLTVGNGNGECTIPSKEGILFTNPIADFSVTRPFACIDENISVNLVTQYTNFVLWDFGNGISSNSFAPTISYGAVGTYPVTLRAKDFYGCEIEFDKPDFITITKPTADFLGDKTIKDCPPLVTTFTDQSESAASWLWDFGDGQKADAQDPANTFKFPGTYSVSLQVKDINGCVDEKTIPDMINVDGPIGVFKNLGNLDCTNDTIRFSSVYQNAIHVQWDFGDGEIEGNMNSQVFHVYKVRGKVQPLVVLTDNKGCEVLYKTDREMLVNQSPKADFRFSPQFPFEGETVIFTPDTTGLQFSWLVDQEVLESDTARQVFDSSGNKTVTLQFADPSTGCAATVIKEVNVQGYPVFVPNVFTPNGDQWNPTFEVLGIEKSTWGLMVYNRWGGQVYKSNDYQNQWRGDDVSTGVYYFELRNKLRSDKHIEGWITIIR